MYNYRLNICYDGTRYKGWQRQSHVRNTLQEKLEQLLSRILQQEIELSASGRTDAGVHARQQCCSFHCDRVLDCDTVLEEIRRYLPEDIGAISLQPAEPRFHARLSCTGKTYVYRIWNSSLPNVFMRRYMLSFPQELDLAAMEKAAGYLCGSHDFSAFCSNKRMKKSAIRNLRSIDISSRDNVVELRFEGSGFLHNMVRLLVGTLLRVGTGELSPEDVKEILRSKDRSRSGPVAPAQGLCLWMQNYEKI